MASIKIDQAFIFEFIAGAFELPIAFENDGYKPVQGTPYAQIKVKQNDTTKQTLNHSDVTDGIFRIYLRYPAGSGAVAAKTKAEEIIAYFAPGNRIGYGGQSVLIESTARKEGIQNNNWYEIIITLSYWASV
jgi:hypothetical protein